MNSGFNNSHTLRYLFDAIRSFDDDEVPNAVNQLSQNSALLALFESQKQSSEIDLSTLNNISSVRDFQLWMKSLLSPILDASVSAIEVEGLDKLDSNDSHIFISNHRDIIMDPLLINLSLLNAGFDSAHCAIGDNLLNSEASRLLAGLNNCFKVVRSLSSPKAMLRAMKLQSEYIRYLHFQQKKQIWIAQKEGRSKDNKDITNPALIKMLSLAKGSDIAPNDYLATLNIVPVSISYEWDPCDIDKATQLTQEANNRAYLKSANDDIQAIQKGLFGSKGKIHVSYGQVIKPLDTTVLNRYEVANRVDTFIHSNYRCFESNVAAYQLLEKDTIDLDLLNEKLDAQQLTDARQTLQLRLEGLEPDIRQRALEAYAAPLLAKYGTK
jgi:Acyltransferase